MKATKQKEAESLKQRLDDGRERIETAKEVGVDTAPWERFWMGLLMDYEAICRDLNEEATGDE